MSLSTHPIYVPYWITGIAAAIGVRAYSLAGVTLTALAIRQTTIAQEFGATAQYLVSASLDDAWTLPVVFLVDDGTDVIHVDIVASAAGGAAAIDPDALAAAIVARLQADQAVSWRGPVIVEDDGSVSLSLTQGDAYTGARALSIPIPGYVGTATPTLVLKFLDRTLYRTDADATAAVLTVAASSFTILDGTLTAVFAPSSANTTLLTVRRGGFGLQHYEAQVIDTATPALLWSGSATVKRRLA